MDMDGAVRGEMMHRPLELCVRSLSLPGGSGQGGAALEEYLRTASGFQTSFFICVSARAKTYFEIEKLYLG